MSDDFFGSDFEDEPENEEEIDEEIDEAEESIEEEFAEIEDAFDDEPSEENDEVIEYEPVARSEAFFGALEEEDAIAEVSKETLVDSEGDAPEEEILEEEVLKEEALEEESNEDAEMLEDTAPAFAPYIRRDWSDIAETEQENIYTLRTEERTFTERTIVTTETRTVTTTERTQEVTAPVPEETEPSPISEQTATDSFEETVTQTAFEAPQIEEVPLFVEEQQPVEEPQPIVEDTVEPTSEADDSEEGESEAREGKEHSVSSDLIRGHINTIILRSLYDGDKYGYEIISEIERKSHNQYSLKQPSLYSALKRLEKDGYITSYWGGSVSGGRRKYFSLTDEGKEISERNQSEWEYSRSVIDSLISDKDYDFSNPAPTSVDMRVLRRSTSRVPGRVVEEADDYEPSYDGEQYESTETVTTETVVTERISQTSESLTLERAAFEEERSRMEESLRQREEMLRIREEAGSRREQALLEREFAIQAEEERQEQEAERLRIAEEERQAQESDRLLLSEEEAETIRQEAEEETRARLLEEQQRLIAEAEENARLEERERIYAELEELHETQRREAEERAKLEEERLRVEAEERTKLEEERAKLEEERLRVEAEEQRAKLEEERAKLEEERIRLEAEERTKLEEERAKLEEERLHFEAEKRAAEEARRIQAEEELARLHAHTEAPEHNITEQSDEIERAKAFALNADKNVQNERIVHMEPFAEERARYEEQLRAQAEEFERMHARALAETEMRVRAEAEERFRQRESQRIHQNYINLIRGANIETTPETYNSYYYGEKESIEPYIYAAKPEKEREYRSAIQRLFHSAIREEAPAEPKHESQPVQSSSAPTNTSPSPTPRADKDSGKNTVDKMHTARSLDGPDFYDLEARAAQDGIRICLAGSARKTAEPEKQGDMLVHKGKALFFSALLVFLICLAEGSLALGLMTHFHLSIVYPILFWGVGFVLLLVTGLLVVNRYGERALRQTGNILVNVIVTFALCVIVVLIIALARQIDFADASKLMSNIILPIIFFLNIVIFGIAYYLQIRPKNED